MRRQKEHRSYSNKLLRQDPSDKQKAQNTVLYLLETSHKVVADWRSRQVSSARASTHIEEVIRAKHGVVLLCVARGGQNAVH